MTSISENKDKDTGLVSKVINGVKDLGGGVLDKVGDWADGGGKWRRLVIDIALFAVALFALYAMTQGLSFLHPNLAAFTNPSLMTVMGMPMMLGAAGVGLSWFIRDAIGKEHKRTAAKIAAIIMPMGLLLATGLLIASGFQPGFNSSLITNYLLAGLIIVPSSLFVLRHSMSVFRGQAYSVEKGVQSQTSIPNTEPENGTRVDGLHVQRRETHGRKQKMQGDRTRRDGTARKTRST